MLDDREYMREPDYGQPKFGVPWHSLTVRFLIAYAVVFLLYKFVSLESLQHQLSFLQYFALSNVGLAHGYLWQLISYQFMHSGWLHLIFNGWAIYMFGLSLESELGKKRFGILMLTSGIAGGLLQSAAALLWPQHFGGPVVGASACAFGLVAAYATLHPNRNLQLLIFFVLPVTVPAKALLIVSIVIALIGFGLHADNVAHAAHLGGMAVGWLFAKKMVSGANNLETFPAVEIESTESQRATSASVDAILDKISAKGIKSLTEEERQTLEAARKKMNRS